MPAHAHAKQTKKLRPCKRTPHIPNHLKEGLNSLLFDLCENAYFNENFFIVSNKFFKFGCLFSKW